MLHHPRWRSANRPHRWVDLCSLLQRYVLGVKTEQRIEENVIVKPEFFGDI